MQDIDEVYKICPGKAGDTIKSIEEMLKDSGPDKKADYFEEKNIL
jgi:hypothetical protein